MKFLCISAVAATLEVSQKINYSLKDGSLLLLISGGSNIKFAVNVIKNLELKNQLTVGLIDERFGPIGHTDSNWTQLLNAGFKTNGISLLPVLKDDSLSHIESAESYRERLSMAIASHDNIVGIFGIGEDGHTAGILPGSPALLSEDIITAFTGPDFPRITTTPSTTALFDYAFLVSYGANKHQQLARFLEPLTIEEQPAQVLKEIENLTVYSDYESSSIK